MNEDTLLTYELTEERYKKIVQQIGITHQEYYLREGECHAQSALIVIRKVPLEERMLAKVSKHGDKVNLTPNDPAEFSDNEGFKAIRDGLETLLKA